MFEAAKLIFGALKANRLSRESALGLLGLTAVASQRKSPSLHTLVEEPGKNDGAARFIGVLSGEEFFLRDHLVNGEKVLPGVAYLEVARIAVERWTHSTVIAFEEVLWTKPMTFKGEPRFVAVRITTVEKGRYRWEIASEDIRAEETVHAHGVAMSGLREMAHVEPSVDPLGEECANQADIPACYERLAAMGLHYGPTLRGMAHLRYGGGAAFSELRVPSSVPESGYELHPTILDGALQSTLGIELAASNTNGSSETALPFGIDRVRLYRPVAHVAYAHVRRATGAKSGGRVSRYDITIVDHQSRVSIVMEGFAAVSVGAGRSTQSPPPVHYARVVWRESSDALSPANDGSTAAVLVNVDRAIVDSSSLCKAVPGLEILETSSSARGVGAQVRQDFLDILDRLRTLLREEARTLPSVVVVGSPTTRLRCAALAGMLKCASRENSKFRGKVIELPTGGDSAEGATSIVITELRNVAKPFEHVRYAQNGRRRVRRIEFVELGPARSMVSLRNEGAVWITGGTGGLGTIFARHLGTRRGARLILSGRSEPTEAVERIARLRDVGVEIEYLQCDVAEPEQVRRTIKEIIRRHGRLGGIIHAAGVLRDARIVNKTAAQVQDVFRPKLDAVLAIDEATAREPLKFFVIFSSLTGQLGNVGQADYAAANAFLDEYVAVRNGLVDAGHRRGRTVAISWPLWRDGGMSVGPETIEAIEKLGFTLLDDSPGCDAFDRILASDEDHVLVAAGDRERIAEQLSEPISLVRPTAIDRTVRRPRKDDIRAHLVRTAAQLLKLDPTEMDPETSLGDYGMDSVGYVEFAKRVNETFGVDMAPTELFERRTLDSVAQLLVSVAPAGPLDPRGVDLVSNDESARDEPRVEADTGADEVGSENNPSDDPVVVVGMYARMPGARSVDAFWKQLEQCRDLITEIPEGRLSWTQGSARPWSLQQNTHLRWGGFLDGVDEFDPLFFNIAPKEAELMDPQHRLFLQAVWGVIEHSGHAPSELAGTNTAIFIGVANQDYWQLMQERGLDGEGQSSTGVSHAMLANRISFLLDLHGPSEPIDTACSSSLVAIHRAVKGITAGEFDMAIAGGINVVLTPTAGIAFSKAGMLAPDGRCRTFDKGASGYVRGEGVGAVFLKRLSRAKRDGDTIYGIIRATAENHGGRANSLTAPNPEAQRALLISAYRDADIDPRSVGLIEAHGTGTALGDPIEVGALKGAFDALYSARRLEVREAHCALGSVKTNVGHLETAAGIAGVLKVLLSLRHKKIPGLVHLNEINPYLKLSGSPFFLADKTMEWKSPTVEAEQLPRRAGVSSFGFGGANAHVVIEEFGAEMSGSAEPGAKLVLLSAQSSERLIAYARALREFLADTLTSETPSLADIAHTLQVGRDPMSERVAFIVESRQELVDRLEGFCRGATRLPGVHRGRVNGHDESAAAVLLGDDDSMLLVESWMQKQKYEPLAALWVKGAAIDFRKLRSDKRSRRVALPTYPFAPEVHWLPPATSTNSPGPAAKARDAAAGEPAGAPEPRAAAASGNDLGGEGLGRLIDFVSDHLKIARGKITEDALLEKFGIDSIMILSLTGALEQVFGALPKTLFFEHQTLGSLARYFAEDHRVRWAEWSGDRRQDAARDAKASPVESSPDAADRPAAGIVESTQPPTGAIAIIGLSGRYPLAENLDEFWENLKTGRDCIEEIPHGRWDYRRLYDPDKTAPGKVHAKTGGFLKEVDRFDPAFFNISPREAEVMDPQERLFLETVWATLEDAGYTREALRSANAADADVGVFVGVMYEEYQLFGAEQTARGNIMALSGNPASIANRVSYFCGFTGPSMAIDTMCSSSLTAIHLACQAIAAGDCAMAIAGGVNVSVHPNKYIALSQGKFLSTKGRCESFAAGGDGYIPAEGVGAVLLKPLARAIADRDRIYGVIRGTAVNHGGKTNGYTVPNPRAQASLLTRAFDRAGVHPRSISYIEAHGTGTSLGDPIEVSSLTKAFRSGTSDRQFCAIGSVKSNIGHAESAAGIAGLTKVLLQLEHRMLVPSIHADGLNPHIDFQESPFFVQRQYEPWERPEAVLTEDGERRPGRRIAGVSAFGAGGSNAHLIVEEYLPPATDDEMILHTGPEWVVLPVSARKPDRLQQYIRELWAWIERQPALPAAEEQRLLADLAFTFQTGREAMEHRAAFVANGFASLRRQFRAFIEGTGATTAPSQPQDLVEAARGWQRGESIAWRSLGAGQTRRRIAAPTYPFARQRHWFDSYAPAIAGATAKGNADVPSVAPGPDPLLPVSPCDGATSPLAGNGDGSVRLEILDGSIAVVRMEDRENKNLFTEQFVQGLQRRVRQAQEDPNVKVIVLTGYERVFCMGGSRESLLAIAEGRATFADVPFLFRGLLEMELPVIAAVQGHAFGGGFLFGLYADLVVLSQEGVYTANFMDFGFTPGLGATYILAAKLGPTLATEMMYTARRFSGLELRERGAPVLVKPEGEVLAEAIGIARNLAKKPKGALVALKTELARRALRDLKVSVDSELEMHAKTFSGPAVTNEILRTFEPWAESTAAGSATSATGKSAKNSSNGVEALPVFHEPETPRSPVTSERPRVRLASLSCSGDESHAIDDAGKERVEAPSTIAVPVERKLTSAPASNRDISPQLKSIVGRVLHLSVSAIGDDEPLHQLGVDSIGAVEIGREVKLTFGVEITAAVLYDHDTIARLGQWIAHRLPSPAGQSESNQRMVQAGTANSPMPPEDAFPGVESPPLPPLNSLCRSDAHEFGSTEDGIAIIGMSGRFPGAPDLDTYWENIVHGRVCTSAIPAERWKLWGLHEGDNVAARVELGEVLPRAGFLDGVDCFDPLFFGISPKEADAMDPQQRLFLQEAWRAMEDAGYAPRGLPGRSCGVFVGVAQSDYGVHVEPPSAHTLTGTLTSVLASRVAYAMDFGGPCIAVDAACASSLSAIHLACESIRRGECEMALAGGVHVMSSPRGARLMRELGVLASDGEARPFDASAHGWTLGEGVAALVLKPLAKALADQDAIYGVIKGSGINQSGRTSGLGAPKAGPQAALQARVHREAGVEPGTVAYLEAQGVASLVGDAIEIGALKESFGWPTTQTGRCALGSLKANIGHLLTASGVAALVKALLALRARTIPPMVGVDQPNRDLGLAESPFYFVQEPEPWISRKDAPRRASINSFGFSGSNAYVVVEEAPETACELVEAGPQIVPLSARSEERLRVAAANLRAYLGRTEAGAAPPSLSSLAHTLQVGRDAMKHRVAFVVQSIDELRSELDAYLAGRSSGWRAGVVNDPVIDSAMPLVDMKETSKLAGRWVDGASIVWSAPYRHHPARKAHLPTYPFEARKCWLAAASSPPPAHAQLRGPNELRQLIGDVLRLAPDELDPDRPLTDYGMDSFLLARVAAELQSRAESVPGLARLQQCSTLSELGSVLSRVRWKRLTRDRQQKGQAPRSFPEIVRLNDASSGRPVFWLHAGVGGVDAYRVLAPRVGRPFLGIEARGWMTERAPLRGIQAMAAYYVHLITNTDPEGPYDLGGYSLGGMLAYEVARQLQELGERVTSIVMVDALDTAVFRNVRISRKTEALHAVNFGLQSSLAGHIDAVAEVLLHRDQVDPSREWPEFVAQLVELGRARGLRKTPLQLKHQIEQHARAQAAFKDPEFRVMPLPDPEGIVCHYFRNREGRFLGALEPYYLLPGDEITLDAIEYWKEWEDSFVRFHKIDVEVPNHMVMLQQAGAVATIGSFVEPLYAANAIAERNGVGLVSSRLDIGSPATAGIRANIVSVEAD